MRAVSGPVSTDLATLPDREKVYSESTSIFFKHTHVFRIVDKKRKTLIYVAISDKVIRGHRRMHSQPFRSCRGPWADAMQTKTASVQNLAYLERAASIRRSLAAVCLTVISSLSNNLRISSTAQATRAGSSFS